MSDWQDSAALRRAEESRLDPPEHPDDCECMVCDDRGGGPEGEWDRADDANKLREEG